MCTHICVYIYVCIYMSTYMYTYTYTRIQIYIIYVYLPRFGTHEQHAQFPCVVSIHMYIDTLYVYTITYMYCIYTYM